MTFDIKRRKEHFVVYINGKFYCTADNEKEAVMEIKEYEKNGGIHHENKSSQEKLWRG